MPTLDEQQHQLPGVATLILAPRSRNVTASVVCREESLLDALAIDSFSGLDEGAERVIFESIRQAAMRSPMLVSNYLTVRLDTYCTFYPAVARREPADQPKWARKFPFATHIDFLSSPVEGLVYDGDDPWSEE